MYRLGKQLSQCRQWRISVIKIDVVSDGNTFFWKNQHRCTQNVMSLVRIKTFFSQIEFTAIWKSGIFILPCLAFEFVYQNVWRYNFYLISKKLKVQVKGSSLSEANIKIALVGLITLPPQAKNIKDDKAYLNLRV